MYASSADQDVGNANDGNARSRWATRQTQRPGQYFEIDLQTTESFNKLVLESQGNPHDYPRGYTVRVSQDGSNWKVVASGQGDNPITTITFSRKTARYIRIEQTGRDNRRWWSIHEVNLYR